MENVIAEIFKIGLFMVVASSCFMLLIFLFEIFWG